ADSFEEAWEANQPALSEDEEEQGAAAVRGGAKDQAVSLCLTHHAVLAPEIKPYRLEEKIEIEFEGAPFDVGGTIDLTESPEPGKRILRDTKTSAKKISPEAASKGLQLQFYSMMIEKGLGEEVVGGGLDVVQKKPLVAYHVPVEINKNYDPLMQRLEAAANVVEKEAFYPVDPGGPSGWVCSAKWCGWWKACDYGEKR
ncbi:MAG: PD-(D/E)XK nuclease family protein, partial [Planctomycetota bacterium]